MARLIQCISAGLRSAQPSASTLPNGSLYYVEDEELVEQVQLGAWELYFELNPTPTRSRRLRQKSPVQQRWSFRRNRQQRHRDKKIFATGIKRNANT